MQNNIKVSFQECRKSTSCLLSSFAVQTLQVFNCEKKITSTIGDVYIEGKLKIYEHAIKLNFVCFLHALYIVDY